MTPSLFWAFTSAWAARSACTTARWPFCDAASSADLTYQITRFKRISASARVPEGLTRREALGLRVEIKNSDGEMILGETYALGS